MLSQFYVGDIMDDIKKRPEQGLLGLAEDMGLEPTRLLHPTRFPGELLSHSVNPPCAI